MTKKSMQKPEGWKWQIGQAVCKKSGSKWSGFIVGFYSTKLTPEGYAVESIYHEGSVQICPVSALKEII